MTNAIQSYTDEDGRKIVYGYEDEVSIQTHVTLEEWAEERRRREYVKRLPVKNYVNSYHMSVASLNYVLDIAELGAII
ncbi:hypothetical protein [Sporosarcina sp. ITBMC105]